MNGIGLSFDQNSINKLRQQFDSLINELNKKGQISINLDKVNEDINKIKLQLNSVLINKTVDLRLNTAQVEGDLKKTVSTIDEAIKHYEQLGKASAINRKYDENGNLKSFTLQLERVDGLLEKIDYKTSAFQDIGDGKLKGIEFSANSITELDKTAKVTEKIVKDEEKLAQQIGKTREQIEANRKEEEKLLEIKQAQMSNKALEDEYNDNLKLVEAMTKVREQSELKRKQDEKDAQINQNKAINENLEKEYAEQQKIQIAIEKTIEKRREEEKVLEQRQASAINKTLEEEYNDNLKLAEAIGKTREQSELKRREDEKQLEVNQAKASNKLLEEQYQAQQKEQQRINSLGGFKANIDSSVFGKSTEEIKKYVESIYGANVEVTKLQKVTDGLGKSTVTMSVKTKEGNHNFTEEKVVLDQVTNSMYKQNEAIKESKNHMGSFSDSLKMAFQNMVQYSVIGGVFYGTISKIKEAIEFTNSLNKSQTNIQMIAGYSRDQIQELTKGYSKLADQLYTTTDATMAASEEFLRAGNSIEETQSLLKATTIGSAVSGQQSSEMAEQLIAISNGFKMATSDAEQMMHVIDTLSTLDNNSATSMKEISTSLTRTASSAQMAGVSFEDLSSYIATVSSVTRRSAETIGESFKTIFARYQDVRGGKEFDADNENLSNVERDLQKYAQIAIRSAKGEFKDFDIVLDELSKKWSGLSEVAQSAISKAMAGTRQRESFLVLMNNLDQVDTLQKKVEQSAGNAKQKFDEAYGQSSEAKLNKLKNSMQILYMEMFNSDMINSAVGGLTTFVQYLQIIASSSAQTKIEIIALTVAIVAMGMAIKSNGINALNTSIASLIPNLINAISSGKVLTSVLGGVKAGFSFLLSPVGLVTMALGYATLALTSHIREQKKLKEETEQLSSSYKDLNEAIKTADMTTIETKAKPLGDTQEQLQNAMRAKAEAEARKKEIQDIVMNSGGDRAIATKYGNELSGLDSTINATSKTIKNLKKELNDSGIAFDEATGEVYKFTEAQNYIKNNQIATEIRKTAEEEYNHKQEIIGLINEYQNLNSIENANADEKQRMSQIAQELQGTISGLSVARDAEGNYIIQNTDLLGKEISILIKEGNTAQTVANVKLTAAKNEAMIEVGKTKVTYAQAKERMNILLAEAKTARDVANIKAQEAAKELGVDPSFMDGMGLSTGANIIEQRSKEEITAIQAALSALDKIYSVGSSNIGVNPIKVGSTDSYVPSGVSSADAAEQAAKAAEEYARALEQAKETANDNLLNLQSKLVSALKAKYEEDKENALQAIETKKEADLKALEEKKKAEIDYYTGKIKQLQDEISALQDTTSDDKEKLTKLKKELASWSNDDTQTGVNKVKEIQQLIADLEKKFLIEDKQKQIDILEEEQKAKEESYEKQEDDMTKSYEERVKTTETYYDNMLKEANIYAEANKVIITNNQQEILDLLTNYAPEFATVGQIMGQSLADAMMAEINAGLDSLNQIQTGNYKVETDGSSSSSGGSSSGSSSSSSGSSTPFSGVLKVGSRGENVKLLQQKLGISADGIFGTQTKNAVKEYQQSHGLTVDGIVGQQTWNSLFGSSSSSTPSSSSSSSSSNSSSNTSSSYSGTLKVGSRGEEVKAIQQKLGISADGIFGTQTKNAVMNYQRSHGLTVDGIVGQQTWNSLFGGGSVATSSSGSVPSNSNSGSYSGKYADWINDAASQYGFDPKLIAAIIKIESGFNPNAVNKSSGATGLGQFLASTARDIGLTDRTDPKASIYALAKYLRMRVNWAGGNLNKGIMGYGEGTTAYLNKVLNALQSFATGGIPANEGLAFVNAKERILPIELTKTFDNFVYNILPKFTMNMPNLDGFKAQQPVQYIYNAPLVSQEVEMTNNTPFDISNNQDNWERATKNGLFQSGHGMPQML